MAMPVQFFVEPTVANPLILVRVDNTQAWRLGPGSKGWTRADHLFYLAYDSSGANVSESEAIQLAKSWGVAMPSDADFAAL
jgi:hypothetical protein